MFAQFSQMSCCLTTGIRNTRTRIFLVGQKPRSLGSAQSNIFYGGHRIYNRQRHFGSNQFCTTNRLIKRSGTNINNNFLHRQRQTVTRFTLRTYATSSDEEHNKLHKKEVPQKMKKIIPTSPDSWADSRKLLALAKPQRNRLLFGCGCLIVSAGISAAVLPYYIGVMIDTIFTSNTDSATLGKKLWSLCSMLVPIVSGGAVAIFGREYAILTASQRIIKSIREKAFASIIQQEIAFHDKNKSGELINRLASDTVVMGEGVSKNLTEGLTSACRLVFSFGMMAYTSPYLTTASLVVVPIIILVAKIIGDFVKKTQKKVQDALARSTQVAEERISNIRTVRAFAQEEKELREYEIELKVVLSLMQRLAKMSGVFYAVNGFLGNAMILGLVSYGGMLEGITVGQLSSFMAYSLWFGTSLRGLQTFHVEFKKSLGASTRLFEIIDRQPSIPVSGGLQPMEPIPGAVEFSNVSFTYPTRPDVPIFSNLNLMVPAGKITALVGSSGSGKSTVGSMLLRYYDPDKGALYLDGTDIRELDPNWLRHHIGNVSQEPVLFSTSIAENISYGAKDPAYVTPERIEFAAKQANAYKFIQSFPQKFDTIVGERGVLLSGGQRQRIAIARAILTDPKILLLDEATSALDAESEYLVQDALEKLMVGRTVITIAHRLSTIKNANQIAVLDNGQIVELGSYFELMEKPNGMFRKLVERQTVMQ